MCHRWLFGGWCGVPSVGDKLRLRLTPVRGSLDGVFQTRGWGFSTPSGSRGLSAEPPGRGLSNSSVQRPPSHQRSIPVPAGSRYQPHTTSVSSVTDMIILDCPAARHLGAATASREAFGLRGCPHFRGQNGRWLYPNVVPRDFAVPAIGDVRFSIAAATARGFPVRTCATVRVSERTTTRGITLRIWIPFSLASASVTSRPSIGLASFMRYPIGELLAHIQLTSTPRSPHRPHRQRRDRSRCTCHRL